MQGACRVLLARRTGQPLVDLGDACRDRFAPRRGGVPRATAIIGRGRHGDEGDVGSRLAGGLYLHRRQPAVQLLLPGEGGLFGGLLALDFHTVAQAVGEGISDIGLARQPGLGRGRGGDQSDCGEGERAAHDHKMGASSP
jgi:hypothetical protein